MHAGRPDYGQSKHPKTIVQVAENLYKVLSVLDGMKSRKCTTPSLKAFETLDCINLIIRTLIRT
jgi:hypothetical protein